MPTVIDLADAFVAGVYLFVGINNLDLYLRDRQRRSHLFLALTCAGALTVDLTGLAARRWAEVPSFWSHLNLLGVAGATVCLFEFVVSLGASAPGRLGRALEAIVLVSLLLVWMGVAPGALFPGFVASCGVLLLYSMYRVVLAGRRGDPDAKLVGRGFLVLSACLILDMLMEMGFVTQVPGMPGLGFTILFLASSRSLNDRFDRAHRELDTLRRGLEERVEERTRELRDANRQLAAASTTDPLTGLPNRRGFLERADEAFRRARRSRQPCTLLMGDVDHFKRVNDTYGHTAGDLVLQHLSQVICTAVRDQDLVARWGGEEIIVLLPDTDLEGGRQVAEVVRRAVAAHSAHHDGREIAVTISFGVAAHSLETSVHTTIERADAALYQAKKAGRDRVEVARDDGASEMSSPPPRPDAG